MRLRDTLPNLEGATSYINGRPVFQSSSPTLVYFWSVSCGDCKKQLPELQFLRREFQGKLQIISIHMPRSKEDENIHQIIKVSRDYDIQEPILVDNKHHLTNAFGTRYVPSYYLFDEKKKLRYYQATKGLGTLTNRIKRILQESGKLDH